jgi:hypothetical protein
MTEKQQKNALIFYNRLTGVNHTELTPIAIEFVSKIDEDAIKKVLVVTDASGGSYAALGLKYNCTRFQVRHWLKTKATTN